MSELTGSSHLNRAQFTCVQTVVGQRFAGNGPNGLSYYSTTNTTTTLHKFKTQETANESHLSQITVFRVFNV